MIKCSDTECSLYAKDGSKRLGGPYTFSEHGGEKGARAAAHKREGQVMHFKRMKKSLADAVDEFGAPDVLEYIIKALGEDCEGVILKSAFEDILGIDGQDIEKAKKKKVRRVTIEDEEDDDDGDEEEKTTTTKKKATPPKPEGEEEAKPTPKEEGGEEEARPTPKEGEKATEGEKGGGGDVLPEGWTPESIARYWESLGGSVESCVAKAPDTVKDKQRFCTRLQAKVGAAGGGEEKGEEPAPPVEKSVDDVLDILAELMVEKAFKRAGAPGGVKYKGETGWDDPRSWIKAGAPEEIRKKAWAGMGGTVTGCIAKVKGKVDDPGAFCASLKDKVTGTTMWRGKKGKEEEAVIGKSDDDAPLLELLDELLYGKEVEKSEIDWDDWESIEKSIPEWDITVVKEKDGGRDASGEDEEEDGKDEKDEKDKKVEDQRPTFLDVVRKSHQRKADAAIDGLVDEMRGELGVK